MLGRTMALAVLAPAVLGATLIVAAPAGSQQAAAQHPASPPVHQQEACVPHPKRLEGTYTDTRKISGAAELTYVNTVRIIWVAEDDDLPPLPGGGTQSAGMRGSAAWNAFHEGETAACPVTSYAIESGSVNFTLDTRGIGYGGPGECTGHTEQTFDASALKKYSALYLGKHGFLITIGAPEMLIPDTTISGRCVTPAAVSSWSSPVNDNVIMLLDKTGQPNGGVVRGQFSAPAGMGWTHSGSWSFAPRQ